MKLFFREYGNGLPLIILHGLYGSSDNWTAIARKLSERFRVILPDARNHGQSPHSPEHTYQAMSNDLMELAGFLNLKRFLLAGHSMGGKTAIEFARRWPDMISGLVVVDMSPFRFSGTYGPSPGFHLKVLNAMISADLPQYKTREETTKIFSGVTGSEKIINFLIKNITRNKGRYEWKLNPANLLANMNNILDGIDRENPEINPVTGFPVLFLRAGDSEYISDTDIQRIIRIFPTATIETIPDTSHWLHAERPDAFIKAINEIAEG